MHYNEVLRRLNLEPLPFEGGFFRQTFKSKQRLSTGRGRRSVCTSIYYLITKNSFSALHRVRSTEIFHYYAGAPVELTQITPKGQLTVNVLGSDLGKGQLPQVIVPAMHWQGARLKRGGTKNWALLGTTVSPGFEYQDFELGRRDALLKKFPQHRRIVQTLTKNDGET